MILFNRSDNKNSNDNIQQKIARILNNNDNDNNKKANNNKMTNNIRNKDNKNSCNVNNIGTHRTRMIVSPLIHSRPLYISRAPLYPELQENFLLVIVV